MQSKVMCSKHVSASACVLLFIALSGSALGYQFLIEGHNRRCFQEEIPLSAQVLVTYTVMQGPGEAHLSLTIKDMTGKVVLERSEIDHGKFAFTSADSLPDLSVKDSWAMKEDEETDEKYLQGAHVNAGDNRLMYSFCFELKNSGVHLPHLHSKDVSRRISFEVRFGADAKTKQYYDELAKEKHLSSTEEMFKAVEDRVAEVVRDVDEMRDRERRMDLLNRKTQRTVIFYSVIACFTVLGGALLSSYATQNYLTRQKVI